MVLPRWRIGVRWRQLVGQPGSRVHDSAPSMPIGRWWVYIGRSKPLMTQHLAVDGGEDGGKIVLWITFRS